MLHDFSSRSRAFSVRGPPSPAHDKRTARPFSFPDIGGAENGDLPDASREEPERTYNDTTKEARLHGRQCPSVAPLFSSWILRSFS